MEIEVFAGAKLYMACMARMAKLYMACMAILRTGRTFYHLEIAQQQFYRAAQKFLTNCHAGPNGSEMVRVLQMRVGWMVAWWKNRRSLAATWMPGPLESRVPSEQILPSCSSAKTSVGARPPGSSQPCTFSLPPVDISKLSRVCICAMIIIYFS